MNRIVFDPGHGGIDPGAVGKLNGVEICEKDLALAIALEAADWLAAKPDYHVEVTRDCDIAKGELSLEDRVTFSDRHKADLFVSIHCNAIAPPVAQGFEVFHYKWSGEGWTAANAVFRAIAKGIPEIAPRSVKPAGFYVLRCTAAPAILVECGFMTDPNDLKLMADKAFQKRYGAAIAQGVINYFA
ncbi:MAG: N-acetylmuramoyl-L-alanine amidase [Chloroflexaceae bacterium]|nr:N-acetylmuramoyl-L-alanine amidase [Chloroflexaceae bacterium]